MSGITAFVLAILVIAVIAAPRKWALVAFFSGILFLTLGQASELWGLRLYPLRVLELTGIFRVLSRRELVWTDFSRLDAVLVIAYSYALAIFLIRTGLGYGTSSEVVHTTSLAKVGNLADVLLGYFTFRGLIRTTDDFVFFLKAITLLLVPYVFFLSAERYTGNNPFAVVGASPRIWRDMDGARLRCMGSFMHPSLLGTLGASFLLLYIGVAWAGANRFIAVSGLLLCAAIVVFANSGSPLSFVLVGVVAWSLWFTRNRMRIVRFALLGLVVLLSIVMKAPIWFLPARMSALFGGTGWHRSYLIDRAMQDIDRWWLFGMPMDLTIHWFPYLVGGAADMTNLYLVFAVDAGLVGLGLFLMLIVMAYRQLGVAMSRLPDKGRKPDQNRLLYWGMGAALTGHVVNFFAITYFDQTNMIWLMLLAAIASVSAAPTGDSQIVEDKRVPADCHRRRFSQRAPKATRQCRGARAAKLQDQVVAITMRMSSTTASLRAARFLA